MKTPSILILWCIALLTLGACQAPVQPMTGGIIPLPNACQTHLGTFLLEGQVQVSIPADSAFLKAYRSLERALLGTSLRLSAVSAEQQASIRFCKNDSLPDEAYTLEISSSGVEISSNASGAGLFYGVQSLLQLMPPAICDTASHALAQIELPQLTINDAPRFPYRGAMMDVGRNFLPKEEVLKFIDLMGKYKMNRFHFHLTDDQGWRIEIKKHPKLTEVGSHRPQTQVGHCDYYWPRRYDGQEDRGFYTQEEIKEIVQYATERFITVIPEIEMPGHSSAALAAYPELSCGLGKTYVVRDYFDVFDEVYCPRPATFQFLEDVLSEVMELFPSHYIHIGGDECPKKAWKKCPDCQALMKREGLKTEEELQSYFIHRMERFVNSKGRDIIGWDEILEGGLAPRATVMSWRGEEGGIEAAQQGHQVIMTPGKHCYFDFYQEDPEFAPLAIGHFLPLDSVYAYNPLPAVLTSQEQKFIIGTQANIWGEYIQTPAYFEYMAFPRLLAMAEVQWTQPEKKNFVSFTKRLDVEFQRLKHYGVQACPNFYEVNLEGGWNSTEGAYEVSLKSFCPDAQIRYALNDSVVTADSPLYASPIRLTQTSTIYAAVYRGKTLLGATRHKTFAVNLATGCSYQHTPASPEEQTHKERTLTDGYYGYASTLHCWSLFQADTLRVVVDLREPKLVRQVKLSSLWRPCNAVWPVKSVQVATSIDGKTYVEAGQTEMTYALTQTEAMRFPLSVLLKEGEARYVRLTLYSFGLCPAGYYHEHRPSRMGFDELEIL